MHNSKILIVDDHALAREGLKAALNSADYSEIFAVGTGEDALEHLKTNQTDLVLLDIRLGNGIDGLETARQINKLGVPTKIVMLTLHENPDYVRVAVAAGASGYLLKDTSLDNLREAISTVLAGGMVIPSTLLSSALKQNSLGHEAQLLDRLTPRERSVLQYITQGLTNKKIARELDISPATVKAHVERVLAKLGVSDRTQAAVLSARVNINYLD